MSYPSHIHIPTSKYAMLLPPSQQPLNLTRGDIAAMVEISKLPADKQALAKEVFITKATKRPR